MLSPIFSNSTSPSPTPSTRSYVISLSCVMAGRTSIMINSSKEVISDLVALGVCFEKDGENYVYTREGAHSKPRILFHEDETGKEITSHLLDNVRKANNITLIENFTMVDLLCSENLCSGIIGHDSKGNYISINADYTVLATGGIGGLFKHSTNYRHLTGDALALALKHNIKIQHIDYILHKVLHLYLQIYIDNCSHIHHTLFLGYLHNP